MATYKLLKDLNIGQKNAPIKIRVSREWESRNYSSKHATKKTYLLLDEEGTQVQALTSQHSLIAWFSKKLKIGDVYMISDYIVEPAPDKYRPVTGEYAINFHRGTIVKILADIPTIPRYKFELTTFEAARSREGDVHTLMDIVGKMTKYTPMQTTDAGKRKVEIILANERNDIMKMELWNSQADDFIKLREEYHDKPNSLVIVTSVAIKLVQREFIIWSTYSTQFFFNIDHPAITALRGNSNMKDDLVPEIVPVLKSLNQTATEDINKMTIEQLFDAQLPIGKDAIAILTEATVFEILSNYGWYYMGCSKCSKKVNELQQCSNCPNNKQPPIPRYKVTVEVEDTTSNTTFILFNSQVIKIIKVSAQHILNNDKNANQEMIPAILNNMLGRKYIFQLKLTSYNTVKKREDFTVTQVEEVQTTDFINAHPQPMNQDAQLGHDNDQNMEHHLGDKRKSQEDENGHPNQPASSATKETANNKIRNKRSK